MNKKNIFYNLFLLAVFLQTIPNLNLTGSNSALFTTNAISLLLMTALGIYTYFTPTYPHLEKIQDNEGLLILMFFIFQTCSVTNSVNQNAFLPIYINVVVGIIVYFLTRNIIGRDSTVDYRVESHSLNTIILLGGLINVLFQLSLLIYSNETIRIINIIFSKNLMEVTKFHYFINKKLYSNFPLEIIPPILFLDLLRNKKTIQNISIYIYLIIIFVLALASNFRYRFFGYFVSAVSVFFLFRSSVTKIYKITLVCGLSLILILYTIFASFNKNTIINRFTDAEEYGKNGTIVFRLNMYELTTKLGRSRLFGIGLGNTYDYLKKNIGLGTGINNMSAQYSLMGGAHNIFFQIYAETGIFGLFSLISMIIFLVIKDFNLLKNGTLVEKKVYMIMFWTLIFISQFIPTYDTTFYFYFFLLRGLI